LVIATVYAMWVAGCKLSSCGAMSYDLTQRERRWQGASTQRIAGPI
jgi:hypothetical protein